MGNEWKEVSLDDVATLRNGAGVRQEFFSEQGVPLVRVSDFTQDSIDLSAARFVDNNHAKKWSSHLLCKDDVLVATVGSWPPNWSSVVGKVIRTPASAIGAIQNQNTCCVLPDMTQLDIKFIYYRLKMEDFAWHAATSAGGSANQARLPVNKLGNFRFSLPPLLQQRAIAHALSTLDNKIELNRQINTTLEAMAQALFKSWFVNFDPVIDNALAAGNPIPDELAGRAERRKQLHANCSAETQPLPAAIQQRFPDRFVFTEEMGWVPEGWEAAPIAKLADLNPESWTAKKHPDVLHYVDLSNTKNGRINETIVYKFSEAPSRARRVLRKDDSIIGTVRPGNRSFAFVHNDGLTGSTGFAVMRPRRPIFRSYIYLALTREVVVEMFAHLADGGAYPAIRPDVVASQYVVIPCDALLSEFDQRVYPWLTRIGAAETMNEALAKTRDTLLPKLLSGQLRIPEAEQLLAEAL